jgi:hypothetical protein
MAYPYPNILGLGQNTPYDRFLSAVMAQVTATVSSSTTLLTGVGSPEGVVVASPGRWYYDTLAGVRYLKVSGSGNTGWT